MSVWLAELWRQFSASLTQHPGLCVAVIVSLQAIVIALLASVLTRFCRNDPQWAHRIWFSAVTLLLVIMPVHVFQGGWQIGIMQPQPTDSHRETDEHEPDVVDSQVWPAAGEADVFTTHASTAPLTFASVPLSELEADEATTNRPQSVRTQSPKASSDPFLANAGKMPKQPASAIVFGPLHMLVGCYVLGIVLCLTRLGWGMWRLRTMARSGRDLNESSIAIFHQAAVRSGLPTPPRVKRVDQVSMPLTFGILRSNVLVPSDFEFWPASDQRAVAMHELMHIKRRDVLCEFLTRVMRAFYWFHPASAYLARRLTLARELATDQCVVACGEERHAYATSVVDVLTRLNTRERDPRLAALPVIAMSAIGNVEVRLQSILGRRSRRTPLLFGRLLVALMLAMGLLTTIRIELVTAQVGPPATGQAGAKADEAGIATATNESLAAGVDRSRLLSAENDLFSRIRDCEVLTVTGDEYDAEFDVSGQVLSTSGQPVEGAIVLLRESSTNRVSAEAEKYIHIPQRRWVRVNDVFARTTTDRNGKFRFEGVKSPSMPRGWRAQWRTDVVAGHPQLGIGWSELERKPERRRVDSGLTIELRPTGSIVGTYETPDGQRLANAMVQVLHCTSPSTERMGGTVDHLDLHASQLTPRATTDDAGGFTISRIPHGLVAHVLVAEDADWFGLWATVATSEGVPLGQQVGVLGSRTYEVVSSPAQLVADPGIQIAGSVVDVHGTAIEGAKVSLASFDDRFSSDARGRFQMRVRSDFARFLHSPDTENTKLVIRPPRDSDLLLSSVDISIEELLSGKPLQLAMQRGVRVSGKVVDSDGQPLAEIIVGQLADSRAASAQVYTDEAGRYELLLPQGQHTLVVGTDRYGYQLPTTWAAMYGKNAGSDEWPKKIVDVSAGIATELEPFVVERTSPVHVTVLLPNGQPAHGATVVLRDEDSSIVWPADQPIVPPPPITDISESAESDAKGRAALLPRSIPSDAALIEAKLETAQTTYHGVAKLIDMQDGVLRVKLELDWHLQGRVLVNDHPVAGAKLTIGESTRNMLPEQIAGVRRNREVVVTDAEGRYRLPVAGDKSYDVYIHSIPGVVMESSRHLYGASKISDGLFECRDLNFVTGTEEIAGRVVDTVGEPIAGAFVYVRGDFLDMPETWLGHASESDSKTDADGRFHLRNVPKGEHRLQVTVPDKGGNPTLVYDATTGDLHVRISVDTRPLPDIPRLQRQHIVVAQGGEQTAGIHGRLTYDGRPLAGAQLAIGQTDRRARIPTTPMETSTDPDGFFRFEGLPAGRQCALYTLMDQTITGVLPLSLVDVPQAGQIAEFGDIATQPAQALTISVRTSDKSPLPAGGRIYVSRLRSRAPHSSRFDLPGNEGFQAEVIVPAVAAEMLEISVHVAGYKVLRTLPKVQRDWNNRYPLRFESSMTLIVVLTPEG